MKSCVFCEIVAGKRPAWRVYEDDRVIAFFDKGAIAEYHTLVIPKRHATNIFDVDVNDFQAVTAAIRYISQSFKKNLGIEAIQIVSSNGAAAQQDVFHLHFHIVPRTIGDGQDICWTPAARFTNVLMNCWPAQPQAKRLVIPILKSRSFVRKTDVRMI